MKRLIGVAFFLLGLTALSAAAASPALEDLCAFLDSKGPNWGSELCGTLDALDARLTVLEGGTTTTSEPAPTSSVIPTTTTVPGSTTTAPPVSTTTSTIPPTTTTTVPPATTIPGELVIPATLQNPEPGVGLAEGEGFKFLFSCINTAEVDCDLNVFGKARIGEAIYVGHGMAYKYSWAQPGQHNHAWWVAGDREGYACAYTFLYDQHPNPFGTTFDPHRPAAFIARATVVQPVGGGYGKVNDAYMSEGERFYDGTRVYPEGGTKPGAEIPSENCGPQVDRDGNVKDLGVALSPGFDYSTFQPSGPQDIRVGLFNGTEIADVRDFTIIDLLVPAHFELLHWDGERVAIGLVLYANNKISHIFYYDELNDGQIVVEVNGQIVNP